MSNTSGNAILTKSEPLFERATTGLAGGISHKSRFVAPYPIYVNRALGSRKWNVDGNEYLDFSMGSASLLLGHAQPHVVKALQEQAPHGRCLNRDVKRGHRVLSKYSADASHTTARQ